MSKICHVPDAFVKECFYLDKPQLSRASSRVLNKNGHHSGGVFGASWGGHAHFSVARRRVALSPNKICLSDIQTLNLVFKKIKTA